MDIKDKISWPKLAEKYIMAVSGGVDSVVLLHLFANQDKYDIVVAHADHGWRNDSKADARLVGNLAKKYSLSFQHTTLSLKTKSESAARTARYNWLEKVKKKYNAAAIITAHHYDDWVETAIINLTRGTNISGLASLRSGDGVLRPMLKVSKAEILDYAKAHNLDWNEDVSNRDTQYARNKFRHELLPHLRQQNPNFDSEFKEILEAAKNNRQSLDGFLAKMISEEGKIEAGEFSISMDFIDSLQLPTLRHFLNFAIIKVAPGVQIDSRTLSQAALQLKTGRLYRLRKLNSQLNVGVQDGTFTITIN